MIVIIAIAEYLLGILLALLTLPLLLLGFLIGIGETGRYFKMRAMS